MRRPNGTGSVTKMPGNRRKPYAVRIPARDRKGRVVQKYLSFHTTQKEAWAALEAYQAQLAAGGAPAPEDIGVTLAQVYDLWSARKYAKAGKASIVSYRASWRRVSRFGSTPVRNIGIDQWQSVIDADEQNGASKSTVNNDLTLMRALSMYALERDWISKDYTQFVKLPEIGAKYEKGAFTRIEVEKLSRMAVDGIPGADAALVLCYTGFRINEFLTLTRFSYDDKAHTLTGGSKTAAGKNRVVPIHPRIQPYIDKWIAEGRDTIYTRKGKAVSSAAFRKTIFAPLMEKLEKPAATPHWCRHTFASMLHAAGADELNIKRLMGHADENVTEHYTHTDLDALTKTILMIA